MRAANIPPTFAVGGTGDVAANVVFQPTTVDPSNELGHQFSAHNGRFINPPFVFGEGGVGLLGKEMTSNLQKIKDKAKGHPMRQFALTTRNINFGKIRWVYSDEALAVFSTTFPPPCQERSSAEARLGKTLFRKTGCSTCH